MLERKVLGAISQKPHTLFQKNGKKLSELVFTRDGFSGGFSILYQNDPPTSIEQIKLYEKPTDHLTGGLDPEKKPLRRVHVQSWLSPKGTHYIESRYALFLNNTCRMSVLRGSINAPYAFCNADYDELYFVKKGNGTLLSAFGALSFKEFDYVLIPRGVLFVFDTSAESELLLIEGAPSIEIPKDFKNPNGQLKLEAPYTHRDFNSPFRLLDEREQNFFKHTITLRNNTLTEHVYSKSCATTVGWDGSVYPIAFNILDYLPKTGKIHLPPNLHLTFQSAAFVVCSFVPRMVDYLENAIPCPYPHANASCDELLYYVSGNFTSRKGIRDGSVSFHPYGVYHGPQPGKYFESIGAKHTDEVAVMIDTWQPVYMTAAACKFEDSAYSTSWKE